MKTYYILKPKKLNLEKLVGKYSPDFKFNIDFAYLIVHFVITYGSGKSSCENTTRLSSVFLQKFNKIYNKHIRFLLENFPNDGAVLRGIRYEKGKSYGYKLPKYYSESGFEIYPITDVTLLRKINNFLPSKTVNEQVRLHYNFLLKHFSNGKLAVYEPCLAMNEVNSIAETEKRLRSAKSIVKIMNEQSNMTLKPTTDGRVHSDITRLSKISRKYLQYDGEFLAEVDISSAVPYFLFLAMRFFLDRNFSELSSSFQYCDSITYMLEKISGDIEKSDVEHFGSSVLGKRLYKEFADLIFNENLYISRGFNFVEVMKYYDRPFKEQFGYSFDGDVEDLQKFAKKRLLSMIFARSYDYDFEQIVFGSMFPKVLKFINEFKEVQDCRSDKCAGIPYAKRHKKLAYFSFQFEAKVMIDIIAREFDKLHRGKVAVFTLHDCLLTTSNHVEELKDFMHAKFIELFEVAPNLTLERSIFENKYYIAS